MASELKFPVEANYTNGMVMCQQCLRTEKREPNCTAFCMECNECLCPACSTSHAVNKTSRQHTIKVFKDAYELNKHHEEIWWISKLAKCRYHSSETVRYICNNHNIICCEKCVSVFGEHRSCNGVVTLDDLASRGNVEAFCDLLKFGKQLAEIERNSDERAKCVDDFETKIIDATQKHVYETKESWKKDIGEFKAVLVTLQKQFEGMKLIGNDVYQYLLEHKINQMKPQMSKTVDGLKRQQACHPTIEDAMDGICTKLNITCSMPPQSVKRNISERRPVTPIVDYDSIGSFQISEETDLKTRDGLADHHVIDRHRSTDTGTEFRRFPNQSRQLQMHTKLQRLAHSYPSTVYREQKQHDAHLRLSTPLPAEMDATAVKSVVGQPFVRFAQENPYTQLDRNWNLNDPGHARYDAGGPPINDWHSGLQIGKRRATYGRSMSPKLKKRKRPRSFFDFLKGRQSSDHTK